MLIAGGAGDPMALCAVERWRMVLLGAGCELTAEAATLLVWHHREVASMVFSVVGCEPAREAMALQRIAMCGR